MCCGTDETVKWWCAGHPRPWLVPYRTLYFCPAHSCADGEKNVLVKHRDTLGFPVRQGYVIWFTFVIVSRCWFGIAGEIAPLGHWRPATAARSHDNLCTVPGTPLLCASTYPPSWTLSGGADHVLRERRRIAKSRSKPSTRISRRLYLRGTRSQPKCARKRQEHEAQEENARQSYRGTPSRMEGGHVDSVDNLGGKSKSATLGASRGGRTISRLPSSRRTAFLANGPLSINPTVVCISLLSAASEFVSIQKVKRH